MTPYAEVIGDPIAHSKSPVIHNFWLGELGIEAEYRKTHVKAGELAGYFLKRRADPDWLGCNITIPHKVAALDYVDGGEWQDPERLEALAFRAMRVTLGEGQQVVVTPRLLSQ